MMNLRRYENLHVAFWLVKDACWCMLYRPLGMIMIVPTLFVAIHITWRTRHDITDLFHNVAITFWICANATWMTGEFFFGDSLRHYAMVFFMLGVITVGSYYAFIARRVNDKNKSDELLSQ